MKKKAERIIDYFLGEGAFICLRSTLLEKRLTALLFLLLLAGTLTEIVGISSIVPLLDFIQRGRLDSETGSFISHFFLNLFNQINLQPTLENVLIFCVLIGTLQFSVVYLQAVASARLFLRIREHLRNGVYATLLKSSPSFFSFQKTGAFVEILHNQVTQLGEAVRNIVLMLTHGLVTTAYCAFLLSLSWKLTVVLIAVAFFKLLFSTYFAKKAHRLSIKVLEFSKEHASRLLETFQAIFLIKALSRESYETNRYIEIQKKLEQSKIDTVRNEALHTFFDHLLVPIILCVLAYLSLCVFGMEGTLLLIYMVALLRIFNLITAVNQSRVKLQASLPGAKAVEWLRKNEDKPFITDGSFQKNHFEKEIDIKNLSFIYPGRERTVLSDINLKIKKGEKIAIVGPSGSGKSTLINLLLRLFDPSNGSIWVDGVNLKELKIASWHELIGFVSQDTFIFNDTVLANLRYGKLNATEDEAVVALKKAHADEFVSLMENGIHTIVGERGVRLSGGERQRIALARAFLRNPEILLMDEATSALDSITESLIEESARELSKNRTSIVIAHRLSTIRNSDRIIVIQGGKVAEEGTHEDLINKKDLYLKYYEMQFSESKNE